MRARSITDKLNGKILDLQYNTVQYCYQICSLSIPREITFKFEYVTLIALRTCQLDERSSELEFYFLFHNAVKIYSVEN